MPDYEHLRWLQEQKEKREAERKRLREKNNTDALKENEERRKIENENPFGWSDITLNDFESS